MIGGKEEVFKKQISYLILWEKNSILCGDNGAGQSAKICNNMPVATTMIVGESFNLGKNSILILTNYLKFFQHLLVPVGL